MKGEPEECGREKSTNTVDSRRAARSVEAQSGRVKEVFGHTIKRRRVRAPKNGLLKGSCTGVCVYVCVAKKKKKRMEKANFVCV